MDISALCSTVPESLETLPSPSSPEIHHRLDSDALALKKLDSSLHGIIPSPKLYRNSSDNVELPHLGYPPPPVTFDAPLNAPPAPPPSVNSPLHRPDISPVQQHSLSLSGHPPPLHSSQQPQQRLVPPPPTQSPSSTVNTSGATSTSITVSVEPVDPIYVNKLIEQCTALCEELDRCRDRDSRPRSEIERQQLIDSAAKTAKNLLASLGLLKQKQQQRTQTAVYAVGPQRKRSAFTAEDHDIQETEYLTFRQPAQPSLDRARPKIKRRTKRSTAGQRCHSCQTTETPEWRRGPDGARTLCNACGLHYSKLLRKDTLTIQSDHKLLLDGVTKINALPPARPSPRLVRYPIIQVQAKPIGSKKSDGVRFINSQVSFPRQGGSIKTYNGGKNDRNHIDEVHSAQVVELDDGE